MTTDKGWAEPQQEPSEEDKILMWLDKADPRNAATFMAALILSSIQYNKGGMVAPERSVYMDLLQNLLNGVKHAAEMDMIDFIGEHLERIIKKKKEHEQFLPTDEVVYMLLKGHEMAKKATTKNLETARRLALLCEISK